MSFDEVIRSVFQPSKESIGKRLFKKMKKNAKFDQNILESLYPNEDDCRIKSNLAQTNKHGLGYKGMLNPNEVYSDLNKKSDQSSFSAVLKSGRKLKITGEAFGYGALEDDDAMDIYSNEDLSQYDFELGSQNTDVKNKKKFNYNQGIVQLEGFIKFKETVNLFLQIKQKYAPPQLPKDWKPKKISTLVEKKSRWDNQTSESKSDPMENKPSNKVQKPMNANLRAVILGENVIHKIGVVKDKPQTSQINTELEFNKELKSPNIVPLSIPKTPLSGYFASKFTRSSTTVIEEPLTAGLNKLENLTSSTIKETIDDNESKEEENKAFIRTVYQWHPDKILCKRFGIQNPYPQFPDIVGIVCMNQDDKSRNMINRLNAKNQKKTLFTNIFENINTNQFTKDSLVSIETDNNEVDNSKMEQLNRPKAELQSNINDKMIETKEIKENDQINEKPKPSIDLFKSIFSSDDEDEDEEEKKMDHEELNLTKSVSNDNQTKNEKKSTGIFSGIDFDLLEDSFDPRMDTDKNVNIKSEQNDNNIVNDNGDDDDDDDDCYGPALPATIPTIDPIIYLKNEINKSPKRSKHKKGKKLKRKKSTKTKYKSKHGKVSKRKRSSSNSSTSGSNSSIDNDNNVDDNSVEDKIFEMIKKMKNRK